MATRFREETRQHELTILRDDGLYRHLRCAQPGTRCMSFDIVTWPGHLAYTGDMGTYVFARVDDMLAFFRHPRPNMSYWSEKVLSKDRYGSVSEFDDEAWERSITDAARTFADDHGLTRDERRRLMDEVECEVLTSSVFEETLDRAYLFRFVNDDGTSLGAVFSDPHEYYAEQFTGRFQWCCHALCWAVRRYDRAVAEKLRKAERAERRQRG